MKITQEELDKIVARIKTGESLRDICKEKKLNPGNLSDRLKKNGTPANEIKPKKRDKTDTKKCKQCGEEMLRWTIDCEGNARNEKTFCSKSCSAKRKQNKNKPVDRMCPICKSTFTTYSNSGIYCTECVLGENDGEIFIPERISKSAQTKINDFPGKENEHEKILRFVGFQHKEYGNYLIFECECKHCGNKHQRTAQAVQKQYSSCPKCPGMYQDYEEITKRMWKSYISGAKTRGLDFTITQEYVWDVFIKQDKKCALSGVPLVFGKDKEKTASLDRIDSSIGYIEGNVQWVHKTINKMKNALGHDEFVNWCVIIGNKAKNETAESNILGS